MRGLAVVIMIQCHTFNSLTRMDLRDGGPYVLTQFVGGMAAPLFLLMAGMTTAFQMESLERREPNRWRRWLISLKRAGYILAIAFTFRFTNWVFSMPHASATELTKVDILNCMGVGMAVLAVGAVFRSDARVRFAVIAGCAIAAAAPLMTNLPWGGAPALLREYLVPGPGRGRFPFFPFVAYIAFGQAIGAVVKRAAAERFDRLMQWSMLIGFSMIFIGQYFSNIPYSIYTNANFWTDSPALVVIRVGICLMIMAGAYLWTEYCAGNGLELDGGDGQELADGLLGSRHDRVRRADTAHQAYALDPAGGAGGGDRHRDDGSDVGAVAVVEGKESGEASALAAA